MRASVSLTSFFSALRSPTLSSSMLIPIIRIISPTEPAPARLSTGPLGIRRWRGARGTLGDLTLQLPSQGLTSGARLALARQGCATGSFRLNCAESLYVRDERGLAMFQRIELMEELEKGRLGLRERPPMLATSTSLEEPMGVATETTSSGGELANQQSLITRRPSLRTQKRNVLASQGMRFDSGGLSSCVTFTEGLCHLEDYVRSSESDSATSDLPSVHSEQEIIDLVATGDTPKLSWLESLRRKTFLVGGSDKLSGLKKKRSTNELARTFSCMDINVSCSEMDLTFSVDTASSSSDDSSHMMEGQSKILGSTAVEDGSLVVSSVSKLRREGSWTRLRRRFSRRLSTLKSFDIPVHDEESPDSPTSIASGFFQIIQQGVTTNFIQPKLQVFR